MNADFSFYLRKSASSAEEQRLSKPGVSVAKITTLFSAGAEVTTCRDGREHGGRHKGTKNIHQLKAGTGNIERRTMNFEHPMRGETRNRGLSADFTDERRFPVLYRRHPRHLRKNKVFQNPVSRRLCGKKDVGHRIG